MQIESVISKQTFVARPLSCNLLVSWRQRWKLLCILLFLSLRWYLTLRLLSMAVGLFPLTWNQYQATLDNRVCIWDSVPSSQMVFSSTVKERRVTFYGWKLCREGYSKWNLFSDAWSEQCTRTSVVWFICVHFWFQAVMLDASWKTHFISIEITHLRSFKSPFSEFDHSHKILRTNLPCTFRISLAVNIIWKSKLYAVLPLSDWIKIYVQFFLFFLVTNTSVVFSL